MTWREAVVAISCGVLAGLLLLVSVIAVCIPAMAQQPPQTPCKPRAEWLRRLAGEPYHEALVGRRLTAQGVMVETAANPATGTWTDFVTRPNKPGEMCISGSGEGWMAMEYVPGDPT
jgi:hypothetical protein